jgi:hypothetical protein
MAQLKMTHRRLAIIHSVDYGNSLLLLLPVCGKAEKKQKAFGYVVLL